jgi:hypothetical protein
MHYTEYDQAGIGTPHEIEFDPETYYDVDGAKLELTTKWRASESGAKENPDNAHGPLVFFWARVEQERRRVCPCIEIGGLWRRGVGLRIGRTVYGLWVPWRRPAKPVLDTPERVDLSPAQLLEFL